MLPADVFDRLDLRSIEASDQDVLSGEFLAKSSESPALDFHTMKEESPALDPYSFAEEIMDSYDTAEGAPLLDSDWLSQKTLPSLEQSDEEHLEVFNPELSSTVTLDGLVNEIKYEHTFEYFDTDQMLIDTLDEDKAERETLTNCDTRLLFTGKQENEDVFDAEQEDNGGLMYAPSELVEWYDGNETAVASMYNEIQNLTKNMTFAPIEGGDKSVFLLQSVNSPTKTVTGPSVSIVEDRNAAKIPAQPSKKRRSVLVEDFLEAFYCGDPEYQSVIEQHLMPYCSVNILTPSNFMKYVGKEGTWNYEINCKATLSSSDIPRFANQTKINFYEPRLFRFLKKHDSARRHKREGLCSFCKPSDADYRNNFDNLFFDLNSSGYLHHLTKQHGVFSNGTEMPLPKIIGLHPELKSNKCSSKIDHVYVAVCPICDQKVKVQDLSAGNAVSGNKFLAYFRHMLTHNIRKNSGSRSK